MSTETQFYNIKILRTYVAYLRNQLKWSDEEVETLFDQCGSEISILDAEDNWFDQCLANSFYNYIVEMTGDFDIAYRVGSYVIHDSAKGIGVRFVSSFLAPSAAFRSIGRIASMYSKGAKLVSRNVTRTSADIHVKLAEKCSEQEYQCRNRIGMLEAITTIFGLPKAQIEHGQCRYKGAEQCEYHITWVEPKSRFVLLKTVLFSAITFCTSALIMDNWTAIFLSLGIAGMSYSLMRSQSERKYQHVLNEQIDALHIALKTNERRQQEALLIRNINGVTNKTMTIDKLCHVSTRAIRREMHYDRVTIFTINNEFNTLQIQAFSGFNKKDSELLSSAEFNLNKKNSQGFLVKSVQSKKSIFISNVDKHLDKLSVRSKAYVKELGIYSLIVVPILFEEKVFGVLTVDNGSSSKHLSINDLELLQTITNQIAVAFSNDLTFETLQKSYATLEQRVSERTQELARAKEKADRANQEKSEFLARMNHEIRTPLTSILGFTDMLKDSSLDTNNYKNIINTISANGKHLLGITSDILDYSKIEANKLVVECISFSPIMTVNEVEDTYRPLIEKKGLLFNVNINLPQPKTLQSDPMRIRQVLYNLLNNALKFTQEGNIVLNSRFDSVTNRLYFEVTDTGIGISEKQSSTLFTPFVQADASTTRKYGGTGLGLTISKRIAELLGGDLTLKSEPGKGSSFGISIQCDNTGSVELLHELPTGESIKNCKNEHSFNWKHKSILLAEDSADIQKLISLYLKNTGVELVITSNGQEAFSKTKTRAYDLILMDMQMPIMDGYTTSKVLREDGCIAPIIALSANAMPDDLTCYKKIGINTYIAKPIDINAFFETLSSFLEPISNKNVFDAEDMDLYAEIIKEFIASLPKRINKMKGLLEDKEYKMLTFDAHNLKGLGGSFGYPTISELARKIEHGGDDQSIYKHLVALEAYCKTNIRDSIN